MAGRLPHSLGGCLIDTQGCKDCTTLFHLAITTSFMLPGNEKNNQVPWPHLSKCYRYLQFHRSFLLNVEVPCLHFSWIVRLLVTLTCCACTYACSLAHRRWPTWTEFILASARFQFRARLCGVIAEPQIIGHVLFSRNPYLPLSASLIIWFCFPSS